MSKEYDYEGQLIPLLRMSIEKFKKEQPYIISSDGVADHVITGFMWTTEQECELFGLNKELLHELHYLHFCFLYLSERETYNKLLFQLSSEEEELLDKIRLRFFRPFEQPKDLRLECSDFLRMSKEALNISNRDAHGFYLKICANWRVERVFPDEREEPEKIKKVS